MKIMMMMMMMMMMMIITQEARGLLRYPGSDKTTETACKEL